jgi:LysW-gamma-L-lysine carboxypeptidase
MSSPPPFAERSPYETLIGLVSRYGPSGEEGPAVVWLVERLHALGFGQAFIDPAGNAVGVMGAGPRQVLLLGHIDTVPGHIPVRIDAGRLYGRGSVDAKGPLAAFVDAAARLGPVEGWQFVVIGAVEEERDSDGARYVVEHYRPELVIIGEPSGWERITLGYKGTAWAEISIEQPITHTASQNRSACQAAVEFWQAVQEWARNYNLGQDRVFDQVLATLRGLSSGDDGFREWARLQVNARLPLRLTPADWYAELEKLAQQVSFAAPDGLAAVKPVGFAIPAYRSEKNNQLVRALLSGIRLAGGQPGFVLKTGTADMNIVGPAWGCPVVAYGPGDSALDHTPDEHITLDEYDRAVQALQGTLAELCS